MDPTQATLLCVCPHCPLGRATLHTLDPQVGRAGPGPPQASAGLVVSHDMLGLPTPQEESEMNRSSNVCPAASCDLSEMLGLKVLF